MHDLPISIILNRHIFVSFWDFTRTSKFAMMYDINTLLYLPDLHCFAIKLLFKVFCNTIVLHQCFQFPDCGTLTNVSNGEVNMSSTTTYLSEAEYYCNPGYILSDNVTRSCQGNGSWSGIEPICNIVGKNVVSRLGDFIIIMMYYCYWR